MHIYYLVMSPSGVGRVRSIASKIFTHKLMEHFSTCVETRRHPLVRPSKQETHYSNAERFGPSRILHVGAVIEKQNYSIVVFRLTYPTHQQQEGD